MLNLLGDAAQKLNSLKTDTQETTPQYSEYFQEDSVALSQRNVPANVALVTLIKCTSIYTLPNYLPTYIMAVKLKNHYSSLQVTASALKTKDFMLNEGLCQLPSTFC